MHKRKTTKAEKRLNLKLKTKLHRVNGRQAVRLYKDTGPDEIKKALDGRISRRSRRSTVSSNAPETKTKKSNRKVVRK